MRPVIYSIMKHCYGTIKRNLLSISVLVLCLTERFSARASSKTNDIRVDKPSYSSVDNILSGQVQVFSTKNDWRIGCTISPVIIKDKTHLARLLCKDLGYENFTSIRIGQKGFGLPSVDGSVEYLSCEDAASLKDCLTVTRDYSACGLKHYIYITCKDLSPIPLPSNQSQSSELSCIRSRNYLLGRGSTTTIVFHPQDIVDNACSTTLTVSQGDFLQVITTENADNSGGSTDNFNIGEKCLTVTHVLVTQSVLAGLPAVLPQRICDGKTTNLYISPVAESVNFTFIRKNGNGFADFRVSLKAKAQLSVDCQQLPIISISIVKFNLTSDISGTWKAQIGQPLSSSGKCKHDEPANQQKNILAFNFLLQDCNTKTENKNNTLVISNEILITRTTKEPGSAIERADRFLLPIECDMKVDPRGAQTPVENERVEIESTIDANIQRSRKNGKK